VTADRAKRVATVLVASLLVFADRLPAAPQFVNAPVRIELGRFTFMSFPRDSALARELLRVASANDTFPGLPRSDAQVLVAIAPDERRFREWIGPNAPEWGAAVAFPQLAFIVLQGSSASSAAGDPRVVLRHELAHLALHEFMGNRAPRWFDEGYASYAAGEVPGGDALAANLLIVLKGVPALDSLNRGFRGSASEAQAAYALSTSAVERLAALDRGRGLTLFFRYWRESGSFEVAVRTAYGVTVASYEERWARSVRWRYGWLATVTHLGVALTAFMIFLLPLWLQRRRRARQRLEKLRKLEAEAERRAVSTALAELLGEGRGDSA
jgi:hypothetical protein